MVIIVVLLIAYVCVALSYWLATAYSVVQMTRRVPLLADFTPSQPHPQPRLSVIVPALNEQEKLASAVQTLLEQDYPDLQIILVDDRSTDDTGQIIDRFAAQDKRVKAIHITELPECWLGKVNALNRGLAEADGEYVVFTDADVHFAPSALSKAVAFCQEHDLDHLTAIPRRWPSGPLLDSAILVFIRSFLAFIGRAWAVNRPRSRSYLGIGAFNLVRRSVFQATEGFEWIKQEVGDDMGVGLLMKTFGATSAAVGAFDHIALHWYETITDASRGAEKAYATLCQFSLLRTIVMCLGMVLLELAPLLLVLPLLSEPLRFIGYCGIIILGLAVFSITRLICWADDRFHCLLLWPIAVVVLAGVLIRAGLLGWRKGGIDWRQTLYTPQQIGRYRKVRFPWMVQAKQK